MILLNDLREKYGILSSRFHLNPLIGEYDDPARQRQEGLYLPLSDEGNAVVYGAAGAGKTSFLNAMLVSLIMEHTPEEVNIYILDFASETLRAFSDAPQVGGVLLSYETEKIGNFFRMLQEETEKRKKLFSDYGGDYSSFIRLSGTTLPSIVVAINNFAAFTESFPEKEEAVSWLSREGTKYGIYFVLTSLGTGGVRFRLLQNFRQLFVLQLNDESDYATVVGRTDGLFPAKHKGRGLVRRDDLYEFQIASVSEEEAPFDVIRTICRNAADIWTGETAKKIPILPETVDIDFLKPFYRASQPLRVPVGVEKNSLGVYTAAFDRQYINLILSAGEEYFGFFKKLAEMLSGLSELPGIVLDPSNTLEDLQLFGSFRAVRKASDCEDTVGQLFDQVLYRNNTYKDALEKGESPEAFEEMVVMISGFSSLNDALSDVGKEKLSLILEKGRTEYGIHIFVGDQPRNLSPFSYEKWFKANVSASDGVFVGSGIADQYLMKTQKTTSEMHQDLAEGFGWVLRQGKPVLVKLLSEPETEEDDES